MANQFFNAAYYLAQNPDVALAGYTLATAEQHYLKFGANENRAPNPYFNATQYLLSYPDLIAAGVTKATALQHYAQYGINENRQPSLAVIPADFSYAQYAAANADLRTAFGITDATGATLTVAQQHSLLSHFLSYGYVEARPGVVAVNGDTYFTTLSTTATIVVDSGTGTLVYNGSTGGDNFTSATAAALNGTTLNGFGGTDTLTAKLDGNANVTVTSLENIVASSTAASVLTVNGTGVSSVTVANAANLFTYNGAKVDSFTLNGSSGNVVTNFASGTTGTADALKLTLGANHTGDFTANGIESYSIALNATVPSSVFLHANNVDGTTLSATLTGGVKGVASSFQLDSTASGALATVTIDASAVLSNESISVSTLAAPVNATITAGAGTDTLTAGASIDTLTGGLGNDTFVFTTATALVRGRTTAGVTTITATDTITDFQAGDTLTLAGTAATAGAVGAAGAIGNIDANGVITFATGYTTGKTLSTIISDLDGAGAAGLANGVNAIFKFGGDTYFVHTAATVAATDVIKLTGNLDTTKLLADTAGAHFAA